MGKESQKKFGLLRSAGIACFQNKLTWEGKHQSTFLWSSRQKRKSSELVNLHTHRHWHLDVGKIDLFSTGTFWNAF